MSMKGQLNAVTAPKVFFAPLVLGAGAPSGGFAAVPSVGKGTSPYKVHVQGVNSSNVANWWITAIPRNVPPLSPSEPKAGSFEIPDPPSDVKTISVTVTLFNAPVYRSASFLPANAQKGLDIYIYQPKLPKSAGITAASVSEALSGSGTPGATRVTVTPWGFSFSFAEPIDPVSLQFGVEVIPSTSFDLGVFLYLFLNGWDISVGWPESWCKSANDILNSIQSGLGTADSGINKQVKNEILKVLQGDPTNLSDQEALKLFDAVSIQFSRLTFDNNHSWLLSDESDNTVVLRPTLALGYPRRWG